MGEGLAGPVGEPGAEPTRRLTAGALLDVWERTLDEPAVVRPATLAAAATGRPVAEILGWDIGRRDAALIALRVHLFGPVADAVSDCPACGARLDVALDLAAIGPEPADPAPLEAGPFRVHHRLPTTADLAALAGEADDEAARRALVRAILVALEDRSGEPVPYEGLAPGDQAEVVAALGRGQDAIDVRLTLRCAACPHEWVAPFDIGTYLQAEIDAWAAGILREVHALATTYGWSEPAILGLSARRRRAYLDLAGAP